MMPKSEETMAVDNADLKNLFGMRRLALAKAFELSIRKQQRALLESVMAHRAKFDLSTIRDNGGSPTNKNISAALFFGVGDVDDPLEGSMEMDAEQKSLFAQEGEILYQLAKTSGVIRLMTDVKALENLAQSCGLHLSQAQLAVGETLDNLERGYSIKPIATGNGKIDFTAFGAEHTVAAPALAEA